MFKRSTKKLKAAIIGLGAVAALFCAAALAACDNNKSAELTAPQNLRIESDYLVWDEVKGAKGYTVEINGEEYAAETNSLDLMEITNKPLTYTIKAQAEGETWVDYSDWSEEIEYKVETPKNLEYKLLDDGTYEVLAKFDENARKELTGKLIIPKTTDSGKAITAIADSGFRQCLNITSVYIPDEIETVGIAAFQLCTSVERVRLPEGLEVVQSALFKGCTSLKDVKIPDSVTRIGGETFIMCTSLEKIDLHEGITKIGIHAFRACRSLKSLILPSTVDNYNVWVKESSTFQDCDSLTHVEIRGGESESYKSDGNCIIRKSDNVLICGCAGSVIPDYVTKINDSAFARCRQLTEINIPSSVKEIDISAFSHCENLRQISLPEGLTTVNCLSFYDCKNLESVYISSTVCDWAKKLSESDYYYTYNNVFPQCPSLKNIEVAEDNPVFKSDLNCLIRRENNEIVEGCAGSEIPDYITRIGNFAFSGCEVLTGITVPFGVKEIGKQAFFCCYNLKEIYLPESLTRIESHAFEGCFFASVTIPDSVVYGASEALGMGAYSIDVGVSFIPECVFGYDEEYPYVYSTKSIMGHHLGYGDFKDRHGLIAPVRKGYTFLGWTTVEGGTQVEIFAVTASLSRKYAIGWSEKYKQSSSIVSVTLCPDKYYQAEDVTFYAVWQKNN